MVTTPFGRRVTKNTFGRRGLNQVNLAVLGFQINIHNLYQREQSEANFCVIFGHIYVIHWATSPIEKI